ncbi:MAG: DegT/DnrJ/EryC1/StrS family aminotransferase [Candidatus Omnitrophota bacterium]
MNFIPVNEPKIFGNELKYVKECIDTNWISSGGKFLEKFESDWASYCGQKYGIGVCNGTQALEMAVKVCNFPKGSEIILPSFTIISCAQAIVNNGCVPVLVDCDPETFCIDIDQVEPKITDRTAAIMPVHIYGHPCDMDPIIDIADRYGLIIIEDAAEVHGGEYLSNKAPLGNKEGLKIVSRNNKPAYWRKCGSFGHISCFSFYANKNITTGEGGMLLTSDDVFLERLKSNRNLCFLKEPRFLHYDIGYNARMTNLQAAIGAAQFENLKTVLDRKIDMAKRYTEALKDLPLQLPIEREWAKNVIWMYSVLLKDTNDSKDFFSDDWERSSVEEYASWPSYKVMSALLKKGIQARPFFIGMHEQPVLLKKGYFKNETYPVTEKIARSGFYLPSGQAISDVQIDKVSSTIRGVFQ